MLSRHRQKPAAGDTVAILIELFDLLLRLIQDPSRMGKTLLRC